MSLHPSNVLDPQPVEDDSDLVHIVCIWCLKDGVKPLVAFCGEDNFADEPPIPINSLTPNLCVVCVDLISNPCVRCGRMSYL